MPQYRYAYDRNETLVDALSLSRVGDAELDLAGRGPFRCAGCDAEVIARVKGEKKIKHFAHKARTTCSEETYLHRLAKQTFYDVYRACLDDNEPFTITLVHPQVCNKLERYLERKCPKGTMEKSYDLTCYWDSIVLERRDGEFIPDVLLQDSQGKYGKVYVEVAVTHFLSDRKRASESRIIEIPIEKEEDIARISSRHLTEADASFLNFPRKAALIPDEGCSCSLDSFYCLFIYQNGRSVLTYGTMREIITDYASNAKSLAYSRLMTRPASSVSYLSRGDVFKELLQEAQDEGFPVRNCLLCRYAGKGFSSFSGQPVFCKYKKKGCGTNEAVNCEAFLPPRRDDREVPR
ncbi:MAG: competence protein CoiA family protein [Armatimonadota bacterium]